MTITILGKRWTLRFRAPHRDLDGSCDHPQQAGKVLHVRGSLRGQECLETFLHECLHAAAWEMFDESWVEQTARDIAREMWRPEVRDRIWPA